MEKLSKAQQRRAGLAQAHMNGQLPEYIGGVSTKGALASSLNWVITYVEYGNYEKGSAFGTGAEEVGVFADTPHMSHRGVSKGRPYVAQATLSKGEGKGSLVFPF